MAVPKKYILYCAQEANFQTRSMLIPYDLIMKCEKRVQELQVLRQHCLPNVPFNHLGEDYIIDQLLIDNFTFKNGRGTKDTSPYSHITGIWSWYADNDLEECYSDMDDKEWYDSSITNVASGFNHLKNYTTLRSMGEYNGTPIEIVEGFLVLDTDDGKLMLSSIETVEQLKFDLLVHALRGSCNPHDNKKQD